MTSEYPVAGRWSAGTASRDVRSPFDDSVIATVPAFGAEDVVAAVATAKKVMTDAPLATHERAAILDRAALRLQPKCPLRRFRPWIAASKSTMEAGAWTSAVSRSRSSVVWRV